MKKAASKKILNIGLFGVDFYTDNKGCEALGYSFFFVLKRIVEKKGISIRLYIFTRFSNKTFFRWILDSEYRKHVIPRENSKYIRCVLAPSTDQLAKAVTDKMISRCDIAIDFTGGDSFSDIYGKARFFDNIKLKKQIIKEGIPLILGSQTYGPFMDEEVRDMASSIITTALEVYARDQKSYQCVKELCGREPVCVTDVAFGLPYRRSILKKANRIKIGLNISGLLWEGGYTRNNQFGLSVDYRQFIQSIIEYIVSRNDEFELHLIPHVFANKRNVGTADDDMIPIKYFKEEGIDVLYAPYFKTPMDAKTYISGMDIFIGSRMHATIAAFSSGVATIPISYSRKFEGLYESLGYKYTVSATVVTTESAIETTIDYIRNYKTLKNEVRSAMADVNAKLSRFENSIADIIVDQFNKKSI